MKYAPYVIAGFAAAALVFFLIGQTQAAVVCASLSLIVGFTYWMRKRKETQPSVEYRVLKKITDKRIAHSGMRIWVEKGASINNEEIAAIERGLEECFERARRVPYDRPLNVSDYIVAIIGDCIRAPESQIWCYKLPAGQYTGTEWDLGGYVLAAGQVIATGTPYGNIIALPEHKGTDLDQLAQVAGFEAEHIILAFCNGDEYTRTMTHSAATPHPLF